MIWWFVTSSVIFIKSANQSSIKLCPPRTYLQILVLQRNDLLSKLVAVEPQSRRNNFSRNCHKLNSVFFHKKKLSIKVLKRTFITDVMLLNEREFRLIHYERSKCTWLKLMWTGSKRHASSEIFTIFHFPWHCTVRFRVWKREGCEGY